MKTISIDLDLTNWLLKPALSAAAAGLAARYINSSYLQPTFGRFGLFASIALLFALFGTFIVLTGALSKDDIGRFINRKPVVS
jgi:hypothetical protein